MLAIKTISPEIEGQSPAAARGAARPTLLAILTTVVDRLETMATRRRSRLALLEMSDSQLKDIGLSRADAEREGLRPAWK